MGLSLCDREFIPTNFLPGVAEGLEPGAFLDIGCYTGRHLQTFSQRGWRSVGVDIDAEALKTAEKFGTVHLRNGEEPLSFLADESFDVVNAYNLFHHVKDVEGTFREALRCLKPRGYFLISENVENSLFLRLGRNVFSKWEGMPVCSRWRVQDWLRFLAGHPVRVLAVFQRSQYRELPGTMLFYLSKAPLVGRLAGRTLASYRGAATLKRHTGSDEDFHGVQKVVFLLQKAIATAESDDSAAKAG